MSLPRTPRLVLSLTALLALTACGDAPPPPIPVSYDDDLYAVEACIGPSPFVAGEMVVAESDEPCDAGRPGYFEVEQTYASSEDVPLLLVGYPVTFDSPHSRWSRHKSPRVAPYRHESSWVSNPSVPRTSAAVPPAAKPAVPRETLAKRHIVRGGLGVPGAKAPSAPVPSRSLDSPAPGRTAAPRPTPGHTAPKAGTPAPKAVAPAPAPAYKAPAPAPVRVAPAPVKSGK